MTEVLIAILAAWGFGFACGMFFTTRDLAHRLDDLDTMRQRDEERLREMKIENDLGVELLAATDPQAANKLREIIRNLRRAHNPARYDPDI